MRMQATAKLAEAGTTHVGQHNSLGGGSATFDGQVNVAFDQPLTSILQGRVVARGLGYTQDRLKIRDAEVRGDLLLTRDRLTLRQMTATALGANVKGQANLEHGQQFHVEGTIDGLDLRQAATLHIP